MNVLVLGSTGFIGTNLTNKLKTLKSTALGDLPSPDDDGNKINVTGASRALGIDLRDYEQTKQLLIDSQPKFIFNLAVS